jgi:predicted GIY-YIG superfamily endonuclease
MLKLENDCYYIGITGRQNPYIRIREHFSGNGAAWTRLNKPLSVMSIKLLEDISEAEAKAKEEKATTNFIKIFGYNNVRGGSHTYSGNYIKYDGRYLRTHLPVSHWA